MSKVTLKHALKVASLTAQSTFRIFLAAIQNEQRNEIGKGLGSGERAERR